MAEYTDNYGLIEPTYAELADIDPLNGNFETIDEIMHASQVSLADAYDLTETYNTGDVVMYQYYMYKCKEDNVTGAWDATKWERTTAGANGSGGGGTEVVANPVGTPTADLQTIEIAGTIYDIPGGGGSGGGGNFKITNLWNYTDDNSGVVPYNTFGPFTLHESITNYDAVFLELISDAGDLSNQWRGSAFTPLYFINALQSEYEPYNINFTSYDQRSSHYVITGNTIECTIGSGGSLNGLVNVWGVKFAGSGAFSAEVIPITAGDGTTSRTFSFNRQPKSIKIYYKSATFGYNLDASLVWGQDFINYLGHTNGVSISGGSGGLAALSYGVDGKSFTITGGNAFGALNDADGAGFMFVDYGEGGGAALDYSTDEQDTGKKWIDDKTIYQKTIILKQNNIENYTYSNNEFLDCLPHDIGDYINVIQVYSNRGTSDYIDVGITGGEVVVVPNLVTHNLYITSQHNPTTCIVTIEYTKATT